MKYAPRDARHGRPLFQSIRGDAGKVILPPAHSPRMIDTTIRELNAGIEALAEKRQMPLLDPFSIFADSDGRLRPEYDFGDGAHLNVRGYRALGEFVRDALMPNLVPGTTIGCLGDSITEGYPYSTRPRGFQHGAEIFKAYPEFLRVEGVTVVNMGIAGDMTVGMLDRARGIVPGSLDACLVMGGVNDLLSGMTTAAVLSTLGEIYLVLERSDITPIAMTVLPIRILRLPFGPGTAFEALDMTHSHGPG